MKPKITMFDLSDPRHRTACEIFSTIREVPLIYPHGHVDPGLFADPKAGFGDPASLLVIPDHYVL